MAGGAVASGTAKSGAYRVQYSAVNSTVIPASVAKDNGLTRDPARALVMVTLQKPAPDAPLRAVPANVTGSARSLMGDKQTLNFRRVESAGSVYSLATIAIEDDQTLTFDLAVTSTDGAATVPVRFNQTFYTD